MGLTNLDVINATTCRVKVAASSPGTPMSFYGETTGQDVGDIEWAGGEVYYNSTDYLLYIQTATSGRGAGTWYKSNDTFVTTSTTTSTTSTTTTTSSTTSTSSTSTSTSSSSSTTSSSTSTSSTTTSA